jgi:general secretion pathway protein F
MGAFVYSALDNKGRLKKGVETADSAKQVRQKLRDQGLAPVSVSPVAEQKAKGRLAGWQHRRHQRIAGSDL